jgi:hypothetical protein
MILPEDSIKYKNCAIFKYRKVRFYRENREESREGPFLGQKWGFWGVKMGVFGGFWGVKMGVFGGKFLIDQKKALNWVFPCFSSLIEV